MDVAIENLIQTYGEMNPLFVQELAETPSPLQFMRFVGRNRPFVVRKFAKQWPALKKWDANYLWGIMGWKQVNVAITPRGNADAVVAQEDGSLIFVEPYERMECFLDFLNYVLKDHDVPLKQPHAGNVKYAQTQNDNLRGEYSRLLHDVPPEIEFARIALGKQADAINLWIGNKRSVTALHKDNYENIYVQVRGQKHFKLLPPTHMPCVNELLLPKGRYKPSSDADVEGDGELVIEASEDEPIPVATWDPDYPEDRTTPYSHLAYPDSVTLYEGDMLYLPTMWYHRVRQSNGSEGFACSVNYWYDMNFNGSLWAGTHFIRDVTLAAKDLARTRQDEDKEEEDEGEEEDEEDEEEDDEDEEEEYDEEDVEDSPLAKKMRRSGE